MIHYFLLSSNTVNTPPPPLVGVLHFVPFGAAHTYIAYGFWAFFVWKRVYTGPILVLNQVWFSRGLHECMNVFTVSIPNE